MSETIAVAIIAFLGTLVGTLGGIAAANKTVLFRLEQLEKKMDKHNNLIERMYKVEERCKSNTNRIDELTKKGGKL